MAQDEKALKPLTPDIMGASYQAEVWQKNVPWLRGKKFKFVDVPADHTLEIRKDSNDSSRKG